MKVDKALALMRKNPAGVRFADAVAVCTHFFGPPRRRSGSHVSFKTPWAGDPRVNLQDDAGKAKDATAWVGHLWTYGAGWRCEVVACAFCGGDAWCFY